MDAGPDPFPRALSAGLRVGALWYAVVTLAMGFATMAQALLPLNGLVGVLIPAAGSLVAVAGGLLLAVHTPRRLRLVKVLTGFAVMEGGFVLYLTTLHQGDALPNSTASFALSLFKTALIAFSVNGGRRTGPAILTTAVVAATEAVCAILGPALGYPWKFDGAEVAGLGVVLLATAGFAVARHRAAASRRVLVRAEDEDALLRTRAVARSQAAAIVHDTVLNDLAVLATSAPGRLPEGSTERLAATLELLASPNWVRDGGRPADVPGGAGVLDLAVARVAAEGLQVRLSGDLEALGTLDPDVETALGGAVEQCLVNTLRHAGTDAAEVVVIAEQRDVSVMITDGGAGFDMETVDGRRLGLAASVRARIEDLGGAVRIFAKPGFGTTVLLTVPRARASLLGTGA
jgi:signal transduction histidine kinase